MQHIWFLIWSQLCYFSFFHREALIYPVWNINADALWRGCFSSGTQNYPGSTRTNDKIKRQLGIGLQVSSITMTVFYIILMYIWKYTFPELKIPVILEAVIWISAVVRIVICMFPQNNWCTEEGNIKLSIIRNAVFAITGIGVIILYIISGNTYGYHMTRMVAAIIISFGCYLPVTLFSKSKPKVGLLMIPKTCAYMWVIVMGLQLLF